MIYYLKENWRPLVAAAEAWPCWQWLVAGSRTACGVHGAPVRPAQQWEVAEGPCLASLSLFLGKIWWEGRWREEACGRLW